MSSVKVQRWDRTSGAFTVGLVALVVVLALVPMGFTPDVTQKLTSLFILVILAVMWNALAGFGGLVSVGQQGFIGIGAYATIVIAERGIDPYMAVVLAALFAGLVSIPTSLLAFRLTGGQFAIGMWVIAEVFRLLVANIESLGGGTGKSLTALNVYEPAQRAANTYWLALALVAILCTLVVILLRSRLGSALQAIRDDEVGAASLGVRVKPAKRVLFLLAAVGCGAAGGLLVASTLRVQPNSIFGVQWTAYMIFMVLLGGLGTFEGPILGALIFFGVQEQFADQGSWYLMGLGVVAIVMTLLMPRGLWGTLVDRFGIQLVPVGYRLRGLPDPQRHGRAGPGVEGEAHEVSTSG
jgi:branched-chain amino acid transport system permease protein